MRFPTPLLSKSLRDSKRAPAWCKPPLVNNSPRILIQAVIDILLPPQVDSKGVTGSRKICFVDGEIGEPTLGEALPKIGMDRPKEFPVEPGACDVRFIES